MKEYKENSLSIEELDKELEGLVESMPENGLLEKKIEQKIKKTIQRIAFQTILLVAGSLIALFLIISPIMNALYPNPEKLNQEPDRTMLMLLRTYWETTEPYMEPVSLEVEKKGFAKYDLAMQIINHQGAVNIGEKNVWMEMVRGTYKNWRNTGAPMNTMGRFDENSFGGKEKYLAELKELPQSAMIYVSIGEKSPRALEDLKKENVLLEWIEVYQPNVNFQGGLNMNLAACFQETDIRQDMTTEELKAVYLSNLENLIKYPELWKSLGLNDSHKMFSGNEMTMLKECYEDAKKLETLESKYYCISGKKDAIIEYLEKTDVETLFVDAVNLSAIY